MYTEIYTYLMYHCIAFTMKFQAAASLPGRCSLRHRLGRDGAAQLRGAGALRDAATKGAVGHYGYPLVNVQKAIENGHL